MSNPFSDLFKRIPNSKYSQTRWSILQTLSSSFMFGFTSSISLVALYVATHEAGSMNTPIEIIMLIFALFLGLLGIIGFVLFCWLGSKWVIGGSEDPMPTKDDVRTIVQSENQIITGKLDEILEAVKDGKNDGNKNKL